MEARFALAGVQEITGDLQTTSFRLGWFQAAPEVNVFGNWIIPSLPEGADYRSLQWYIDRSYDKERNQVVAAKLLELFLNEPWQKSNPHFDLSIIGHELRSTAEGSSDAGALVAVVPHRIAIISVAPLRRIEDERLRLFALRRTVGHHLGHLLGIPSHLHPAATESPTGGRQCTNICSMREAEDLYQLVKYAVQELNENVFLCPSCKRDLLQRAIETYLEMN